MVPREILAVQILGVWALSRNGIRKNLIDFLAISINSGHSHAGLVVAFER